MTVTRGYARQVGQETRELLRAIPDRRLTLRDVDLVEGEAHEPDVPVGSALESGHDLFVGYPGERAAIIPVDGERSAHDILNLLGGRAIPSPGPEAGQVRQERGAGSPRRAPNRGT